MHSQLSTDLRAARKLIEKKEQWFGGDNPRTDYRIEQREQLCALQAISSATAKWVDTPRQRSGYASLKEALSVGGDEDIVDFNNSHTHAEVLDLFDRAIQAADSAPV